MNTGRDESSDGVRAARPVRPSGAWGKWRTGLLAVVWCAGMAAARAHPAFLTSAEITVEADGRFHGRAEFDLLAFALNDTSARIGNEPMEQLLAGSREALAARLEEARGRFRRGFQVTTDVGAGTVDALTFPTADEVIRWRDTQRPVLPVVIPVTMSGHLPAAARQIAVRFPSVLEQVILDVERPGEEPFLQPVEAGRASAPLPLQPAESTGPTQNNRGEITRTVKAETGSSRSTGSIGAWLTGTRFFLLLGGLVLVSFAGALGWSKLTANS